MFFIRIYIRNLTLRFNNFIMKHLDERKILNN